MSSDSVGLSRKRDASGEHDDIERPAMKRRLGKETMSPSNSNQATHESSKSQWITYRVRRIPSAYDEISFHGALCDSLHVEQRALTVHSFSSDGPDQRVATITFDATPSKLQMTDNPKKKEWRVYITRPYPDAKTDTIFIDTKFIGFTPISPLANDAEHVIDCISIHGWGSHPLGGFKAHKDTYVWLRDSLAAQTPNLRIFIYGYACDLTNPNSIATVDEYAGTFRLLLRAMRKRHETGRVVPLVFIAHSLGGIVLKQAMILMKESLNADDNRHLTSTYGILFFGVPNQGMETEALAAMIGNNPQRYDLSLLNQNVGHILRARKHKEFCKAFSFEDSKIISFYETEKSPTIIEDQVTKEWTRSGPPDLLVKPESAVQGRPWEASDDFEIPINATHSDMVKFSPDDQDGYVKTSNELHNFAEHAIPTIVKRFRPPSESELPIDRRRIVPVQNDLTESKLADCLVSLAFPGMNFRQRNVQHAHKHTCEWILQHHKYISWLDKGCGILWIMGNPGSGKSTLMKFLLRDLEGKESYQKSIKLSFFFHGRGTSLQKSQLGMYRSLLHQLLVNAPAAGANFHHTYQLRSRTEGKHGVDWDWHIGELRTFFTEAMESVTKTQLVNVFVDAIDEASNEPDKQTMSLPVIEDTSNESDNQHISHSIVEEFHHINDALQSKQIKSTFCFSSRHYPILLSKEESQIHVEVENRHDISAYVRDKLQMRLFSRKDKGNYQRQFEEVIIGRANGIFQWAAVAVSLAIRYCNETLSLEKILTKLSDVPKGLAGIYEHIFNNVIDKDYRRDTLRLFGLVCFANRPLSLIESTFAMGTPDFEIDSTDLSIATLEISTDPMTRERVVSLSGGLVEVANGSDILQFIHQSVKDHILANGFQSLEHTAFATTCISPGQEHHRLSVICANYIKLAAPSIRSTNWDAILIKEQSSFMLYASSEWFPHAEKAENFGVPQEYIIRYTQSDPMMLELWLSVCSVIFPEYSDNINPSRSSILHIVSAYGLLGALKVLLNTPCDLELEDGDNNRAIHRAIKRGHVEIVETLLSNGVDVDAQNDEGSPLDLAVDQGHHSIVNLLLRRGAGINKITRDTEGLDRALCSAAKKGHVTIARLLLAHHAEVNAQIGFYGNALQAAAVNANAQVVQLLLAHGADVNAPGGFYGSALQAAAKGGDLDIVRLLLNRKADINVLGGCSGHALQAAALNGHPKIVQLLLETDPDRSLLHPNFQKIHASGLISIDCEVENLMICASEVAAFHDNVGRGNLIAVRTALENGMLTDVPGGNYSSPLVAAAFHGQAAIISLLLEKRTSELDSNNEDVEIAFDIAAVECCIDVLEILSEMTRVDLNSTDECGRTHIWTASACGHVEVVKWLLGKGADHRIPDEDGVTPMAVAIKYEDTEIVEVLRSHEIGINLRLSGLD